MECYGVPLADGRCEACWPVGSVRPGGSGEEGEGEEGETEVGLWGQRVGSYRKRCGAGL